MASLGDGVSSTSQWRRFLIREGRKAKQTAWLHTVRLISQSHYTGLKPGVERALRG
jgi:hypothetical protein